MSPITEDKSGIRRTARDGRFAHKTQGEPAQALPVSREAHRPMAVFEAEDTVYRGVVDDKRVAAEVARMVKLAMRQGRDPSAAGAWLRELEQNREATILA